MSHRRSGSAWFLVPGVLAVAGIIWILIPPFPPPSSLIEQTLPALRAQFGPPQVPAFDLPAALRPARSVAWSVSRGMAVWRLQADWQKEPADDARPPDHVSRCLSLNAILEAVSRLPFLPCDMVFAGRVWVSPPPH